MLEFVATAPDPSLTIDGAEGTITGVRFVNQVYCAWCRDAFYLWTDGGTIKAGLRPSDSGKTARWYVERSASARPTTPDSCPNCGHEQPVQPGAIDWADTFETVQSNDLLFTIWTTIREAFPDLVEASIKR